MEKNETQLYDSINQITNSFIKLKCEKSRNETMRKYNFSRNSFLNNKTSLSINSFKSYLISNTNSEDISNKNEVLFKSDINSNSKRKTSFINSNKFNKIFLRKIKSKKNQKNFIGTKSLDIKKCNIIQLLNKSQNNKRKIDFIKYKFLLGQKNYYKNLFNKDDFSFYSYYSKRINPYFKKNTERFYFDKDKLKKLFFGKDEQNIHSIKDFSKYLSIYSFKNINKIRKQNNLRMNNYNCMKMNHNYIVNKLDDNKENNMYNKTKEIKNIIDDNYNEYLKDISSSDSNKSNRETKNINIKNQKFLIKKSKSLKYKLALNICQKEIKQYTKRINKYNNSNITIKNNNNLLEFKKPFTNRMKLEDISKCITIENPILRKKLILEKGALK